jgi:hypothetical protein
MAHPLNGTQKKQNTIESSTFGSEFVALTKCTELIECLRYKLRMMGLELDGPANVFCDNKSVVTNDRCGFNINEETQQYCVPQCARGSGGINITRII